MSAKLEFMIPKADSEAFNTAVYRFMEIRRGAAGDGEYKLTSEPFGPVERKTVSLGDDDELQGFALYWSAYRRDMRSSPPVRRSVPEWTARKFTE